MSRRDPRQPDRRPDVRPTSGRKTSATRHRSEAVREVPERAIGLPRARTALKRRSAAPSTAASPDPRVRTSPTCVSPMSRAHVSSSPSAPSGPAEGTSSLARARITHCERLDDKARRRSARALPMGARAAAQTGAVAWRLCPPVIGPPLGAGGGSCPASFRDYERAVILSSPSGTVVARDEFSRCGPTSKPRWSSTSLRRGREGVEGEELDDQALPAMRSHELERRCVLLGDRVGVSACDAAQACRPRHGLDLSPHAAVLLRGPVPERALRVAASAVGEGTRVRIRRQDQPQRCGGSPVAEPACEEFADVAREQVGRLGRREVAAARHRRPAADVV